MSAEAISIEETNKLRIQAGLKPLTIEKEESAEKKAEANYLRLKNQEAEKINDEKIKQENEDVKKRIELAKKFKNKGLGEKTRNDSAMAWLKNSKKILSARAKAISANYDEIEQGIQNNPVKKTKSAKLVGNDIQVAHNLEDFGEGEETVLTLKDSNVLEEEEDVLINPLLVEKEKLEQNLENKKKKSNYNPYDDDEFDIGNNGLKPKTILSHYDDEIDGPVNKKKGFKINSLEDGSTKNLIKQKQEDNVLKGSISLDFDNLTKVNDYYTKEEAAAVFKKPKSKKRNSRKKNAGDEDLFDNTNTVSNGDEPNSKPVPYIAPDDANFVDDDDLQLALAKARNKSLKNRKVFDEEAIAKQILESKNNDNIENGNSEGGLVISETSEFVQNLASASIIQSEKILRIKQKNEEMNKKSKDSEFEIELTKEEINQDEPKKEEEGIGALFEEESKPKSGLAAALAYFTKKGVYKPPTEEKVKRDEILTKQTKMIEQLKNRESSKGKSSKYDSRSKNFIDESITRLSNYKPEINLEYRDAHGNLLNEKEAFKELSHKFHGKGSGLKKTEKHMAKKEQQRKLENLDSNVPFGNGIDQSKRQKVKKS